MSSYQNYNLKELNPDDYIQESRASVPSAASTVNPNWSPSGNYTYVLQSQPSNGYMSALISVNSVNFSDGSAEVSYVLVKNESDSEPINSNGLKICKMESYEITDSMKKIVVIIDENMSLEFSGDATSQTAYFVNDGVRYRLKSES